MIVIILPSNKYIIAGEHNSFAVFFSVSTLPPGSWSTSELLAESIGSTLDHNISLTRVAEERTCKIHSI